MKKLEINNSKKLIIGLSIIFCAVILIIGTAFAYFTQSISKDIDDIVSNDQLLLEYKDDLNDYMRGDLIPTTKENAITAYNREADKKCLDINDYSACSIYRFSIKNISDVYQSLIMTLNPTANSYTNLKFMLYEITEEGSNLIQDTTDLIKGNIEPINLYKTYILNPNKTNTYELVFYIEAQNYDQTVEDSGKRFGAGIRINSITTGKYVAKNFGPNCWNLDETNPEKLVKFNGINHDTGEIDEMCTGYVSQDTNGYYSVNVPSSVGGQDVTIIGNNLFNAYYYDEETGEEYFNKYSNIKEIKIQEGIEEIEDGDIESVSGAFIASGFGIEDENYNFNLKLPNTLIKIGDFAFHASNLTTLVLPINLKMIGQYAFSHTAFEELIIPASVETIGESAFEGMDDADFLSTVIFAGAEDGTSKLQTIGDLAFAGQPISSSLIIPASVETIGEAAFDYEGNNLIFMGAEDGTSKLRTIGEQAFSKNEYLTSVTIPASIEEIGEEAFFKNKNLKSLKFVGALDGTSELKTIGNGAFGSCDLTYETEDNPLFLPSTITSMGSAAFGCWQAYCSYNKNLKYIFFAGDSSNFPTSWNGNATVITKFPNNNHLNVVG